MAAIDYSSRISRAWGISNDQIQPGLRLTDTNPQELGHRNESRPTSSLSNISSTKSDKSNDSRRTDTFSSPPPIPPRTDSLENPSNYSAGGAAALAQAAQEVGKGMSTTLAAEKNSLITQNFLDRAGAPGIHADLHASIAKQIEQSNNNRANTYSTVGAMFGPLGMLIGQLGAELTQKKVDFNSDDFKTARTFNGNYNPQTLTSVNAASSINQNEPHIQSTT